LNAAAWC